MDADVASKLLLEPTPNDMPVHAVPWLVQAKADLQAHFDSRVGAFPVYDRAAVIRS